MTTDHHGLAETASSHDRLSYSDRLRAEGRAEGRADLAETFRKLLWLYLNTKLDGTVTAQQWRRVEECHDPEQLNAWLLRAFQISAVGDLFDD